MNGVEIAEESPDAKERILAALEDAKGRLVAAGASAEQAAEAVEAMRKFAEKDYDRALRSGPITYTNRAARRASARAERNHS